MKKLFALVMALGFNICFADAPKPPVDTVLSSGVFGHKAPISAAVTFNPIAVAKAAFEVQKEEVFVQSQKAYDQTGHPVSFFGDKALGAADAIEGRNLGSKPKAVEARARAKWPSKEAVRSPDEGLTLALTNNLARPAWRSPAPDNPDSRQGVIQEGCEGLAGTILSLS